MKMTGRARWLQGFPGAVALIGPIAVLLALLPYVADAYWQQLGYRALQLYTLATAWNLLAGYAGQTSLGVAAFVGCGAYCMVMVENALALPFIAVLPLSGAVAAAFAALLSRPIFRLRGLYFTIGTLAMTEALRILMVNINTFGGASGLIVKTAAPQFYVLYWVALLLAVCAELTVQLILSLPWSLSLRAVRDDEDVARQMGVRTFRVKLLSFAISSFFMGAVGGLQAMKLGSIEPYGSFGLSWTIDSVAAVIIGGLGTRGGPLLGTILYIGLAELLRGLPALHSAIAGVVLLLVIRFAPNGVWSVLTRRRRAPSSVIELTDV
jgi:branched-chain amino acid transport system permease protein